MFSSKTVSNQLYSGSNAVDVKKTDEVAEAINGEDYNQKDVYKRPVPDFSTPRSPRIPPPKFPESQLGASMFPADMGNFPESSVALRDVDNDDFDDYDRVQDQSSLMDGFGYVDDTGIKKPKAYLVHKVYDKVAPPASLLHRALPHHHAMPQPIGYQVSCHQAAPSCGQQAVTSCQPPTVPCQIGGLQTISPSEIFISEKELWVPKEDDEKEVRVKGYKKRRNNKGKRSGANGKKMKELLREEADYRDDAKKGEEEEEIFGGFGRPNTKRFPGNKSHPGNSHH